MSTHDEHTKRIEINTRVPADEVAVRLRAIADGLEGGTLQVKYGPEALVLEPNDNVDVELRVKQKGRRENVKISLAWARRTMPDGLDRLRITDTEADTERAEEVVLAETQTVVETSGKRSSGSSGKSKKR